MPITDNQAAALIDSAIEENNVRRPMRAVTSSSNLFRRALCLGSAREEAKYSEQDSEHSYEGTMLHALFFRPEKKEERDALTPDQRWALEEAERMGWEFVNRFREIYEIDSEPQMLHETTLELTVPLDDGSTLTFPGHSDITINWPKHNARVILDAKFGWLEVPEAADNEQLASYGVQAQERSPVAICGVALLQPRNFGPRQSEAIYTAESLEAAKREIIRIVKASLDPDAPLTPSDKACHFCRAKAACPAFTRELVPATIEPTLAVQSLTNEQIDTLKQFGARWDKIKEALNSELKQRIEAGTIEGWKLRSGGFDRTLTDSSGFFEALQQTVENITATEYDALRDLSWTKLKKLVAGRLNLAEKKADELIKEIAAPFVVETQRSPSAIRIKEK